MKPKTKLQRRLNFPLLVLYGLGTTIGAGIYALVGEVAGISGIYAPWAFIVSAILAGFTAISFAELSSRFPSASGSALYVLNGFNSVRLSTLVGLLVALAGLTSASALTNAFVGYAHHLVGLERFTVVVLTVLAIGGIAAIGIVESVAIASIITVIEIFGLLLVVGANYESIAAAPYRFDQLIPPANPLDWSPIFAGAFLAFYAFLGFEDMVVVAEEVKDARRILPLSILTTLGITTGLYLLVMTVAVISIPLEELAASEAPLSLLYEKGAGNSSEVIDIIAILAIINGALIQVIMASRLLYGLGSNNQIPAIFGYVYPKTQTPLFATAIATSLVLLLSLPGTLGGLAESTSLIMLTVFSLVNLSAWRIQQHDPTPHYAISFPSWIPLVGFVVSSGFVLIKLFG